MKFTIIANNDFDGVGQTAINLSNNLIQKGHNCETLVLHKKYKNSKTFLVKKSFFKKVLLFFFNFLKKDFKELFGIGFSTINFNNIKKKLVDTDIIIIFTFYKIISNYDLERIFNLKKIVYLRPLDIEMTSGGCHANNFCNKFQKNCNECPKLYFSKFIKFPEINLIKKKELINKYKPRILVQNFYVKNILDTSTIFKNLKKNVVYIGTNPKRIKKISRNFARKFLKIDIKEKIILFATFNLNSNFKGAHLLRESLNILDNDIEIYKKNKIRLITFGNLNGFNLTTKNILWTNFAPTKSDKIINYILRASNVLVCPSLFCFGPHIVEEALMNKIPVVAYKSGSAIDFIKNGQNGYLVEKYDTKDFANSIKKVLIKNKFIFNNNLYKHIKKKCSSKAETEKIIKLSQEDLDKKIV